MGDPGTQCCPIRGLPRDNRCGEPLLNPSVRREISTISRRTDKPLQNDHSGAVDATSVIGRMAHLSSHIGGDARSQHPR
jgi:hypothetical protein